MLPYLMHSAAEPLQNRMSDVGHWKLKVYREPSQDSMFKKLSITSPGVHLQGSSVLGVIGLDNNNANTAPQLVNTTTDFLAFNDAASM